MSSSSRQPVVVPAYTAAQVQVAEGPYLEAGVPLMLRAATALAEVISETVKRPDIPDNLRILFLVGSGNNGGDALFAAAQLAQFSQDKIRSTYKGPADARMAAGKVAHDTMLRR